MTKPESTPSATRAWPATGKAVETLSEDLERVQLGAVRGIVRMVLREVAIRGMGFLGGIVLARLLVPAAFGEYAIAYFLTTVFALFSELGLGAAFIRKPGRVTEHELNSLFTFQVFFVAILAAGMIVIAPLVSASYHDSSLRALLAGAAIAFVLTSLRTVPSVISERALAFGRIALADTVGQVGYWIVAVSGALAGFGVWSLVAALITSSAIGTALLYITTRWRPRPTFDLSPIRNSLRFGALYQGQTAASFLKDSMAPALGGVLYGTAAVGYTTWAIQLAGLPNQLTQLVGRVSYPAYAQLQHDRTALDAMVISTLKWTARLALPAFAVLIGLTHPIILYVYGQRWLPAELPLCILYVNMICGIGTGTLIPAIYSVGRAGLGLSIQATWTVLTYAAALAFFLAGLTFPSLAAAISVATVIALAATLLAAYRGSTAQLVKPLLLPIASAALIAIALQIASRTVVRGLLELVIAALLGGLAGVAINVWADRATVRAFLVNATRGRRVGASLPVEP